MKSANEILMREEQLKFNTAVNDYVDKFEKHKSGRPICFGRPDLVNNYLQNNHLCENTTLLYNYFLPKSTTNCELYNL